MARREQHLHGIGADLYGAAVLQPDIGIDPGLLVGRKLRAVLVENVVARHVVVVRVGVEDMRDPQAQLLHARLHLRGVVSGVHDRARTACLVANQVAEVAVAARVNLLENHS